MRRSLLPRLTVRSSRFVVAAVAVLAGGVLAGCGGDDDPAAEPSGDDVTISTLLAAVDGADGYAFRSSDGSVSGARLDDTIVMTQLAGSTPICTVVVGREPVPQAAAGAGDPLFPDGGLVSGGWTDATTVAEMFSGIGLLRQLESVESGGDRVEIDADADGYDITFADPVFAYGSVRITDIGEVTAAQLETFDCRLR